MHLEGFVDKVAVVTGCQRGIGLRIGETLAAQGATVAGIDVREPKRFPGLFVAADVASESAVNAAFDRVEAALGHASLLVLNAGVLVPEPLEQTSLESWRRTLDINLTGAFLCGRRAVGAMCDLGYGRIVAIGSSAGVTGGTNSGVAYGASKAGVMTLAKSIASEFASAGVTSNALAPALIDTDMTRDMHHMRDRIPVGRLGTPDDVADLVAFLCSAHVGFITGEVIDVNGGFLID